MSSDGIANTNWFSRFGYWAAIILMLVKYGFLGRQILIALVLTILLEFGNIALVVLTPDRPRD